MIFWDSNYTSKNSNQVFEDIQALANLWRQFDLVFTLKEACDKALNLITLDLSKVLELLVRIDATERGEFKRMLRVTMSRQLIPKAHSKHLHEFIDSCHVLEGWQFTIPQGFEFLHGVDLVHGTSNSTHELSSYLVQFIVALVFFKQATHISMQSIDGCGGLWYEFHLGEVYC